MNTKKKGSVCCYSTETCLNFKISSDMYHWFVRRPPANHSLFNQPQVWPVSNFAFSRSFPRLIFSSQGLLPNMYSERRNDKNTYLYVLFDFTNICIMLSHWFEMTTIFHFILQNGSARSRILDYMMKASKA